MVTESAGRLSAPVPDPGQGTAVGPREPGDGAHAGTEHAGDPFTALVAGWLVGVSCARCGRRARPARVREAVGAIEGSATVGIVVRVPAACPCAALPDFAAAESVMRERAAIALAVRDVPARRRYVRKVSTTVYFRPDQDAALRVLSAATHRPVAQFVREAIDAVLAKHAHVLEDDFVAPE